MSSSVTRGRTRSARWRLPKALRSRGLSIWWDKDLHAGADYGEQIEKRIQGCKCVLALWSPTASKSVWVNGEARRAFDLNKLVSATLETATLPLPFNARHSANLTDWSSSSIAHEGWAQLERGIAEHVVGFQPAVTPEPPEQSGVSRGTTPLTPSAQPVVRSDLDRNHDVLLANASGELSPYVRREIELAEQIRLAPNKWVFVSPSTIVISILVGILAFLISTMR